MKHILFISLISISLTGCFPIQQKDNSKTGYYVIAENKVYTATDVIDTHNTGGVSEERIFIDPTKKTMTITPRWKGEQTIQLTDIRPTKNDLAEGLQALATISTSANSTVKTTVTGYDGTDVDRGKVLIFVCVERSTSSNRILSMAVALKQDQGTRSICTQYTLDTKTLPNGSGVLF